MHYDVRLPNARRRCGEFRCNGGTNLQSATLDGLYRVLERWQQSTLCSSRQHTQCSGNWNLKGSRGPAAQPCRLRLLSCLDYGGRIPGPHTPRRLERLTKLKCGIKAM
jgi:hypothetical protein